MEKDENRNMIWLLDNTLIDQMGHHLQYALSLYRYAENHHIGFRVLGHKEVTPQVTEIMPVEPAFRYDFHRRFIPPSQFRRGSPALYYDFIRSNLEFYRDLKTALKDRVGRDGTIFMPMVNHRQLLAWAWWLHSRSADRSPAVVLMLRLNYYNPDRPGLWKRTRRQMRGIFKMLEVMARGRRLRIATDSERLAQEYSELTRLPISVFPIPHAEAMTPAGDSFPPAASKGRFRCVALGDAREEKGFPLLVDAIRILGARGILPEMEFILQCHIGSSFHSDMQKHREVLEAMKSDSLQLIPRPLGTGDYYRILHSADLVLLPYRRGTYYARTSGPMAEAFAAAKPVVVTEDTWMSEQLRRFGAGTTFRDGDPADLARAVIEARANHPALAERARANRPAWIKFHNPDVFFNLLLKDSEP
jgi:glycosyltransferase involved in cell wall biosynthesis